VATFETYHPIAPLLNSILDLIPDPFKICDRTRKRYWGQHLWARGYFAVTVGNVNTEDIQRYIEQQEEHHKKDDFKISEF
jgi:REP element-mobilizing transposase RayT